MMETIRDLIAVNVRRVRKSKDLNQDEAAELCGIALRSLQRVENPSDGIEVETLLSVARGLGVHPSTLMLSPSEVVPPSPQEALRVLSEFVEKSSQKPEIEELIALASRSDDALARLLKSARAYAGVDRVDESKRGSSKG